MSAEDAGDLRVALLGPPGAGKGTQAERIADDYGIPHIATGDIFRENVQRGTELGEQAAGYMEAGDLVPDEIVLRMVHDRLREADAAAGFVLDGFPRTLPQARALEGELEELGRPLDVVLRFAITEDEIVRRITGRRVCTNCGMTYHLDNEPADQSGICDRCGHELIQRSDDTESTVRHRMDVHQEQTQPLEFFYSQRGLLRDVDAEGEVDVVSKRALDVLRDYANPIQ